MTHRQIRIALQSKGRLREESLGFLARCGIYPQSAHDRSLTASTNIDGVDVVFLRHVDIPEYVQAGVADFGIVGKNLLFEKDYAVLTRLELPFAFCRLVIAVSINSHIQSVKDLDSERIATSYPQSVRKFLKSESIHASISFIQGSVEVAPSLGLAEAICDLTQTGKTLKENNLKELITVMHSQAVIIESCHIKPEKHVISQKLTLM